MMMMMMFSALLTTGVLAGTALAASLTQVSDYNNNATSKAQM